MQFRQIVLGAWATAFSPGGKHAGLTNIFDISAVSA
jgi:hypothetical protein